MSKNEQSATNHTALLDWRDRLRQAVRESGKKQNVIAREAGATEETVSRVLTSVTSNPRIDTLMGIAHATGHTVGWLLGEHGYSFSPTDIATLRAAVAIIETLREQLPDENRDHCPGCRCSTSE